MSKNTRSKSNSLSASNASENNDLNEIEGGLEAVMQTMLEHVSFQNFNFLMAMSSGLKRYHI